MSVSQAMAFLSSRHPSLLRPWQAVAVREGQNVLAPRPDVLKWGNFAGVTYRTRSAWRISHHGTGRQPPPLGTSWFPRNLSYVGRQFPPDLSLNRNSRSHCETGPIPLRRRIAFRSANVHVIPGNQVSEHPVDEPRKNITGQVGWHVSGNILQQFRAGQVLCRQKPDCRAD